MKFKETETLELKNRLEIYNPGRFPDEYSPADFIKGWERSVLRNPAIANALFLASDIERWGSGLKRIYDACHEADVEVEFQPIKSGFLVILHRRDTSAGDSKKTVAKTAQVGEQVTGDVARQPESQPDSQPESMDLRVIRLLLRGPLGKAELSAGLGQKEISGQLNKIVRILLSGGSIEMTIPDKPNSRLQKYRLTEKGRKLIDGKK